MTGRSGRWLIGVWLLGAAVAVGDDADPTSVVTHVEYGPLGFMKQEFPKPEKKSKRPTLTGMIFKVEDEEPEEPPEEPEPPRKRRERHSYEVFNLPLVCVFRQEDKGDGQYYQEWLDMPLVTTFALDKKKDESSVRFLDVPLATVYQSHRKDGEVQSKSIAVPLAKLHSRRRLSNGNDDWTFLQAPLFTTAKSQKTEKTRDLTLFDGPMFYLLKYEGHTERRDKVKVLGLPIFGPVFDR